MLPFLKVRKNPGVMTSVRSPDEKPEEDQGDSGLEACAQDILRAIEDKDYAHLALALRSAFDICDSEPHEEGPDTDESSNYDSQNAKAAKGA